MNRRQALRLKRGTRLICASRADWNWPCRFWVGELVDVVRGGANVLITEGKCPELDWCGPGTGPNAGEVLLFPFANLTVQQIG